MMGNHPGNSKDRLLNLWREEPGIQENIAYWHKAGSIEAMWSDFPDDMSPQLRDALKELRIYRLFAHQNEAWQRSRAGDHVVVTTGTASGKSLCYNLPVVEQFLSNRNTCSLYLFPTKALAQDQEKALRTFLTAIDQLRFSEKWLGLYDGDTTSEKRRQIRKESRFVFTNPDMLHQGILPFHTSWDRFFENLKFIIIDEIHAYRGIFGSHVANLLRRLKRITSFYGSKPQFIMTSATIANPQEFACRLLENDVSLVSQDGAPRGTKNILLYNPPVIQKELGIRKSAASEVIQLSSDLLVHGIQTLIFVRSRKSVEFTLIRLHESHPEWRNSILSYRSGYLPKDRRFIEQKIQDGSAKVIVSTNALELGIDIGSLDAILMMGYPGTISAFHQQAGRAGRKDQEAIIVMVAGSSPVDQFLIRNPDYLFSKPVEHALINPDNLIILLQHLRCAIYELPFMEAESFGDVESDTLRALLDVLRMADNIHYAGGKHFWVSDQFPAGEVSLRTAGEKRYVLQANVDGVQKNIGEIDDLSAQWMTHPQAIYLHAGQFFLVTAIDVENSNINLEPVGDNYYTEPSQRQHVHLRAILQQDKLPIGEKMFGEIQVTSQVTGYKRIDFQTNEVISTHLLDMPEIDLITTAAWLRIDDRIIDALREMNLWTDDRNDYGPNWPVQRQRTLERDGFACQVCGREFPTSKLHVHHKVPYKKFSDYLEANLLTNLVTLCSSCHLKAEMVVRVRSGLGGLGYVLHHIAPLILMCSYDDIGVFTDPNATITSGNPCVLLFDRVPAGIGLSENIFRNFKQILSDAHQLVSQCECSAGCPSCVGAPGEQATGAKQYTEQLLRLLNV